MLKSLHLSSFRSYSQLNLDLTERVTLILGPNATGKTNILEAVYLAATGHSFRADDSALISYGSEGYRVDTTYDDEILSVAFRTAPRKQKRVLRNEVAISQHTLLGLHPVVLFEPGDLTLLTGPPARRRRYLDLLLSQTSDSYYQSLVIYRRLIKQRNALLWRNKRSPLADLDDQLFILDTQLIEPTRVLYEARKALIIWLEPIIQRRVDHIAKDSIGISMRYLSSSGDIFEQLQNRRQRDIVLGTTSVGPHREDWQVLIDEKPIEERASRGENRTLLLALKLAEVDYYRHQENIPTPTLLLDDVFSELDESRRHLLIEVLDDIQTIITSTDIDRRLDLPAQVLDLTRPLV